MPCVERIIHSAGSLAPLANIKASKGVVTAATKSLKANKAIICDSKMLAIGIASHTRNRAESICLIDSPQTKQRAEKLGITRSRAAVHFWKPHLPQSLVVIGNAPTALEELLLLLTEEPNLKPAAIFGFCCGFVGAAKMKQRLIKTAPAPYLVLSGNSGGSAMAAAAVNALLVPR